MTIRIEVEHPYSHSLEAVFQAFSDPNFYVAKFEALGNRNVRVIDARHDGDTFSIDIEREVRLDVPRMLASVLGEWNPLLQKERWLRRDDGYANELSVTSEIAPMAISGTMVLCPEGKECRNDVTMVISSKVPLVGRRLEQFAADGTEDSLEEEFVFITDYLKTSTNSTRKKSGAKKKARRKTKKK